jgi:dynein heavy chain
MKLDHEIQTYDLVNDKAILLRTLQDKLTDYNFASASKMNLVFFEDALIYLCAITRILQQPRGNAMLIGVSGSGK